LGIGKKIFDRFISNNNISKKPKIINVEHHKIKNTMIDFNALKVIGRLKKFGFEAYIVGGSIRDYLLGKKPKDFDVATNATPKQIRKYFSNSRIIGRRFKLVHIIFKDTIIETATFRSEVERRSKSKKKGMLIKDNNFGSIEDDVIRRDFGINALYYDPENETIIDYVGGYDDVKAKIVRPLKKPSVSFLEDPVRMLRAVKYTALLGLKLEDKNVKKIKQYASELSKSSVSRLHEEINKIFKSEKVSVVINELCKVNLLKYLIPFLYEDIAVKNHKHLIDCIAKVDELMASKKTEEYELYWGVFLFERVKEENLNILSQNYAVNIKAFFLKYLSPLKVPNKTSDYLGKVFYLYCRLQTQQARKYSRRIKKLHYFEMAKFLMSIFDTNKENVDFWTGIDYPSKAQKPPPKKRKGNPKRNSNKQIINPKKVITTKNFIEKE
jgi:poly(A) polymerase